MEVPEGKKICSLCGVEFTGWGHNPRPVLPSVEQRCCNDCNDFMVIPARMSGLVPGTTNTGGLS